MRGLAVCANGMRGISLCSGVGGIELGLRLACGDAYSTACFVEREAYPAAVLAARMGDGVLAPAPIWSDLRTFDAAAWRGRVDIVTGGYPCQPFSTAGSRRGDQDERHLWPHVLRVLVESEAGILFIENVRGHVSLGLREVLEDLAGVGFNAEWDVFSAEEEGAPHLRERLFVLAYSDSRRLKEQRQSQPGGQQGARRSEPHGLREVRKQQHGENRQPWWQVEPVMGRVANGPARRVDQLRALGNGVVPAVAARAWRELTERAIAHDQQ